VFAYEVIACGHFERVGARILRVASKKMMPARRSPRPDFAVIGLTWIWAGLPLDQFGRRASLLDYL